MLPDVTGMAKSAAPLKLHPRILLDVTVSRRVRFGEYFLIGEEDVPRIQQEMRDFYRTGSYF